MQKIRFNNQENVYEVSLKTYNYNKIKRCKITFSSSDVIDETTILSGFVELNEYNFIVQADFTDMKYLYKKESDTTYVLSNTDGDVYVEPKPVVTFSASFGGNLSGDVTQIVEKYEELVIPTPVANENYEFIKWSPEIPASGVVDKDVTFTALFEHVETLEEVRNAKITEFNTICSETIIAGQDITLSDGNTIHFSYTAFDQTNLGNGANLALSTKESVPYYDSNNNCYIFKPMDMVTIYASCQGYATYLLTLDHHLEAMIKKMDDKDAIKVLVFAEESMDAETKTEFDAIMTQAQVIADKYMANALEKLG